MQEDPAGILIKIGQGAKPGDGGLLMAEKNVKLIQEIRGVPKADLLSPPNHQGLYSIEESVQKMFLSMNCAFKFKVPVAIKVAASSTSVSVYNNLLRDPYNIVGGFFIDGLQGGTGAAHEISLNHTGHPIVSKLRDCYLAAHRSSDCFKTERLLFGCCSSGETRSNPYFRRWWNRNERESCGRYF